MFKKTLLSICIISILSGCATHRAINTADKDISAMHSAENVDKSKAIGDLSQTTLNEDLFLPVNDLDNMFIALEQDNVSDLLPKIMIKDRSFSQANAFDVVRDLLDGTGISFTISSETTTSSLVNASISAIKINGFLPDLVEQLSKSLGFHYSYNAKTKNLDIYLDKQYISKVPPVNEIFESLPNMLRVLGGTNVFLDKSARNISYRANKVAASKIEKYLKEIRDSRVLLTYDTYIWEVSLNDGNQMGINWNNLSSNLAYRGAQGAISVTGTGPTITNGIGFGMVLDGKNGDWSVDSLLSVLRSVGTVKTVSQPRINLLSGTNASFNNGETINYVSRVGSVAGGLGTTTTTTETNSVLSGVAVNISGDYSNGTIYSDIKVSMNDLLKFNNFNALGTTIQLPQTANREITSRVRVRDNDVIILGGLIYDKSSYEESGIPFFGGNIIANNISDSRSKKELVIMLKPRVIKFGKANGNLSVENLK